MKLPQIYILKDIVAGVLLCLLLNIKFSAEMAMSSGFFFAWAMAFWDMRTLAKKDGRSTTIYLIATVVCLVLLILCVTYFKHSV